MDNSEFSLETMFFKKRSILSRLILFAAGVRNYGKYPFTRARAGQQWRRARGGRSRERGPVTSPP